MDGMNLFFLEKHHQGECNVQTEYPNETDSYQDQDQHCQETNQFPTT